MHLLHWNSLCCFLKRHVSCWLCAFNCCAQEKQSISLEPGGQFELSGAPVETLHQTCAEVNSHLYQVNWDRYTFLAFAWLVLRLIQLLGLLWYRTSVFFPNNVWETSKWSVSIKKYVFLHVLPKKRYMCIVLWSSWFQFTVQNISDQIIHFYASNPFLSRIFHSFTSTLYVYLITFLN